MEKASKLLTEFLMIEKLADDDEAFASFTLNPTVTWTKFVLADDKPNANRQRVPVEEFENLIKTGVFMPIKMAEGKINDGHDGARPIGVITHLKKLKNQIIGLAALWSKENPNDIDFVKQAYAEGRPLQLSWEILFTNSTVSDEGVEELHDTALRAVTLVGLPSYEGRTPILEVAAKKTESEDESMEELEKLQKEYAELKDSLVEKEKLIADKEKALADKDVEFATLKQERDSLAEFKQTIDKEKEEADKLTAIKTQFKEAGLEKDDEYFDKNKKTLFAMEKEELDFFVQEIVSFKPAEASKKGKEGSNPKVPAIGNSNGELDPKSLAEYLRKSNEAKK
jgi:hypothetical protein